MAQSQFVFYIQGLVSENVTSLTYKRKTVLESFVIILQSKRLAFYDPETRAKRAFILLPSAWLPYRAAWTHQSQTAYLCHHNKVTDIHMTSFIQQFCPVGSFDIRRGLFYWCQRDFSSSFLSSDGCKSVFSSMLRMHMYLSSTSQIGTKEQRAGVHEHKLLIHPSSCPSQETLIPACPLIVSSPTLHAAAVTQKIVTPTPALTHVSQSEHGRPKTAHSGWQKGLY